MFCFDLPRFAEYITERLFCPLFCHQNPKWGKIRQIDAVISSKNVVGIEVVTTKGFMYQIIQYDFYTT